jgi:hypothetical protein
MKRKITLAILGTLLQGSAHAVGAAAITNPTLNKDKVGHSAPAARKKTRAKRVKKTEAKAKLVADKVDPQTKVKQDAVTETPPGSIEQSVDLRGVRG